MSTLDGIQLFDTAGLPSSGAAFLLNSASKVSGALSCPGGWEAQVKTGGRYIIARNSTVVGDYEQSRDAAFLAAQQGLDLFSIARTADMGIRNAETEHIVWWHEAAGQVVRTMHVSTINTKVGGVKAVVLGPDGQPKPEPPVPPVTWHESLRYFRLSQTTDDLFDSYRNLYLALESILDRMAPQIVKSSGKPRESEGQWFKRALGVAHTKVGLGPYAPKGSTNPVDDLFEELYVNTRTALFHAKGSRPSLLPHTGARGQETVAAVVERLGHLFMKLAGSELNTHSSSGFLFAAGFNLMTQHLKAKVSLHATDDPDVEDPDNTMINPTGGTVIDLETRHAPELEKPYVRSWFGHVNGDQMEKLTRLTGVVSKLDDGTPMTCGTIEGVLMLSGIARFECQMSIRNRNAQLPRGYFAS
jgi:hypothetical protein